MASSVNSTDLVQLQFTAFSSITGFRKVKRKLAIQLPWVVFFSLIEEAAWQESIRESPRPSSIHHCDTAAM